MNFSKQIIVFFRICFQKNVLILSYFLVWKLFLRFFSIFDEKHNLNSYICISLLNLLKESPIRHFLFVILHQIRV
ncbi:MAG: hypothetical protein EGR83_08945 [Bacteroides cellulosilyticus]|nr:hypothetical protein [Bacteroides cellulosilyticus]